MRGACTPYLHLTHRIGRPTNPTAFPSLVGLVGLKLNQKFRISNLFQTSQTPSLGVLAFRRAFSSPPMRLPPPPKKKESLLSYLWTWHLVTVGEGIYNACTREGGTMAVKAKLHYT